MLKYLNVILHFLPSDRHNSWSILTEEFVAYRFFQTYLHSIRKHSTSTTGWAVRLRWVIPGPGTRWTAEMVERGHYSHHQTSWLFNF